LPERPRRAKASEITPKLINTPPDTQIAGIHRLRNGEEEVLAAPRLMSAAHDPDCSADRFTASIASSTGGNQAIATAMQGGKMAVAKSNVRNLN
jgi:hypothetical protein